MQDPFFFCPKSLYNKFVGRFPNFGTSRISLSNFPSSFSIVCRDQLLKIGLCRHCINCLIYLKHLKTIQSFKFNKLRQLNIVIKFTITFN